MNNAKQTLNKIKTHVTDNRVAYAAGSIAIAAVALQQRNRKAFDAFLISKGIDLQEYYCPEAYEEKMNGIS